MSTTTQPGEPGHAGEPGDASGRGGDGGKGGTGGEGGKGDKGDKGDTGRPGTQAIVDLTEAQEDLAAAVRQLVITQKRVDATVRVLTIGVRRLVGLCALVLAAVMVFGVVFLRLGHLVRTEGNEGRQQLKCVVAVLFRQDPPRCPGAKEALIEEGILPQGWPATTTTTRP